METLASIKTALASEITTNLPRAISATFVGSGAGPTATWDDCSDLDLLLLFERLDDCPSTVRRVLTFCENSAARSLKAVVGWGVVARPMPGVNCIHVLVETGTGYWRRSGLLRRSASKYSPFFGLPPSDWSPPQQRTLNELLTDWDGPASWASRIVDQPLRIDLLDWEEVPVRFRLQRNFNAEHVDEEHYAILHSVRNTLRLFSDSLGDRPLPILVDAWRSIDGPQADFLDRVISQKLARRTGVKTDRAFRVNETRRFLVDCCFFLHGLRRRNGR